jgi:hypothetical protein
MMQTSKKKNKAIKKEPHLTSTDWGFDTRDLVRVGLIAYETPLYQVLALDPPRPLANIETRGGPPRSLREWLGQAGERAP